MPHENPFGSLIAIYIVVDDPQTGLVIKLAGHVQPDPLTGQLTTTVEDNPQAPFEDFTARLLRRRQGAAAHAGDLRHAHDDDLAEALDRTRLRPRRDPLRLLPDQPGAPARGRLPDARRGPSPTPRASKPAPPPPLAAAYSPFSLRLARADGSQEIKGLDLTLPPGLTGKLAGLAYCSEAALATAAAKPAAEASRRAPPARRPQSSAR